MNLSGSTIKIASQCGNSFESLISVAKIVAADYALRTRSNCTLRINETGMFKVILNETHSQ